jgi:glycosyltransferase involved in cell wall biosynthesis
MADQPDLTVIIPCYNSSTTIRSLVAELATIHAEGGLEIVLVNDGSRDDTAAVCTELAHTAAIPVTFVDLARNFGEHNAVMAGLRFASGRYIITADDDGQNSPSEIEKLYAHARTSGRDVVYTYYGEKQHERWRNWGSWMTNTVADLLLDKPRGLYLSSFRCMTAFVAEQIGRYDGPYPYVDGLIFQVTQNVGGIEAIHEQRRAGRSNYTLRKLAGLWLNLFMNFSVVPLRVSSVLGLAFSVVGFLATLEVVAEALLTKTPPGWGSFMSVFLVFAGVQLLTIGLVGEYVGRMYLTVNRRPQWVVRQVVRKEARDDAPAR